MTERPILFNGAMVRAILDGRKTQTRRVFKVTDPCGNKWPITSPEESVERFDDGTFHYFSTGGMSGPYPCPYGVPGDRLWVREAWQHADWTEDGEPFIGYRADDTVQLCHLPEDDDGSLMDRWAELSDPANYAIDNRAADRKWRPSIFMPRWASRITLEVTDVRVERLQEISEEDAQSEGIEHVPSYGWRGADGNYGRPRYAFQSLWDSINAKRGFPWESNSWVWVVEFLPLAAV